MPELWLEALSVITSVQGITMIVAGAAIGLLFGMLPGLGASQAMILILPFTFGMDSEVAILLFVAILATASFGGSLPAILLNTPGTPANVVTTLDGYPMAMRGEANRAIAVSAVSCMLATMIGALVLLMSIPLLQALISAFHSQERFWLIVSGLFMIALASRGNAVKGIVAGAVGVLVSFIGRSQVFPAERFTLGLDFLYDGVPLAAFLVGVFAVAPIIVIGSRATVVTHSNGVTMSGESGLAALRQGFRDVYRSKVQAVRGSLVGVALGVVPAVGGAAAAFINYFMSKQFSRPGKEYDYGQGNPEGLIASETANDAKDGGTLMPTLSFGIPGDPNTAVLLGALMFHGIPLGHQLFGSQRDLLFEIIIALVAAQFVVSLLGMTVAKTASKLTTISTSYIVPLVFATSAVGAYLFRGNPWDLAILGVAALLAYFMTRHNYPPISLVLGYMLGVEAERNFMMSMRADDRWYVALLDSWISWILIGAIVLTFAVSAYLNRKRGEAAEDASPALGGAPATTWRRNWTGAAFSGVVALIVVAFAAGSFLYDEDMRFFPLIVAALALGLLTLVVAGELTPKAGAIVERLGGGLQSLSSVEQQGAALQFRTQLRIIAWLATFVVSTLLLGFLVMPLFAAFYLVRQGGLSRRAALVVGLGLAVPIVAMGWFPDIRYWAGAIPEIIPGFLGGGSLPPAF